MSVIVKGMEMPKNCDTCWALDDYGDYPRCRITEEQRGYNFPVRERRMDNCPLTELPPHGRLIDADKLKSKFRHSEENSDVDSAWISTIRRFITQAETIIEAEGKT